MRSRLSRSSTIDRRSHHKLWVVCRRVPLRSRAVGPSQQIRVETGSEAVWRMSSRERQLSERRWLAVKVCGSRSSGHRGASPLIDAASGNEGLPPSRGQSSMILQVCRDGISVGRHELASLRPRNPRDVPGWLRFVRGNHFRLGDPRKFMKLPDILNGVGHTVSCRGVKAK
jgi:hypothetical protein